MHLVSPRRRVAASVVVGLVLVNLGMPGTASAQFSAGRPAKPSWTESITSGMKRGWDGLTRPFSAETPTKPAPDPTLLGSHAQPSPRLHVEVARLNEHSGRFDEAERHYQAALAMDRNDLSTVLNYARLKDRQGEVGEAFELYRYAVHTHPEEASVYNYLGLHYDRRGMPNEAAATFAQAVRRKPEEPLYRNNLAHVLVQLDQLPAAYEHLHAVHGEAVAYYNLGYLLHQRGRREAAVQHLAAAVRRNPNLTPAQQLLAELAPDLRASATNPTVATVPPPASTPRPGSGAAQAPPGATRPWLSERGAAGSHGGPPRATQPVPRMAAPGAYQPPAARGDGRPPEAAGPQAANPPPPFSPAHSRAPAGPPPASAREPMLPGAFRQPGYAEPPVHGGAPMPHRSSNSLKQPQGLARDAVRLNAPHIERISATLPIPLGETEEASAE